jgi:hypothetical protein
MKAPLRTRDFWLLAGAGVLGIVSTARSFGFDGACAFGIGAFGSLTLSTLKGALIAVW